MAFDVEGARKAGYSDQEIAEYLGKSSNFDVPGAVKAGYSYREVLDYLAGTKPKAVEKVVEEPKKREAAQPTVLSDEDTSSDFIRGMRNYMPQLQETYGGAKVLTGLLAQKVGAKETGKSLIESGIESMDTGQASQTVRESDSFLKAWEKGISTVITDWLPYQMGSGVANIAETLAAMGVGAGVGALTGAGVGALPGALAGAVSKTLVKKGVQEAAEKIAKEQGEAAAQRYVQKEAKQALVGMGVTAGMAGQAGLHGMGEVTSRAVEEAGGAEGVDLGRVVPAAIAHGVADYFINKIGLDSLKIGEKASKYLAVDIAKRIGVTGAKQVPAEEIQTIAERYGANLSLTDAQAISEYVDTAAAAFGMSVVPGAVGGAKTHVSNKFAELAKRDQEEQDRKPSSEQSGKQLNEMNPPADAELEDKLRSTVDATGAATNITQAPPPAPAPAPASAGEKKEKVEVDPVKAATDYIAAIDAGTQKPNVMKLNSLLKGLGIERPESGAGYAGRSVEAIKQRLAQQGAPSATGTQQPAVGAGAGVAGESVAGAPTAGTTSPDTSGVVSAGTTSQQPTGGAAAQPTTVAAPAPAPAEGKTLELQNRRNELESLITDDSLPETHPKIKNKLKALNKLESELGLTLSTYDNISFVTEPETKTLKAKRPTTVKGWLQHFLTTGEKDPKLTAIEQDTTPAFVADPNATSRENLQAAVALGQKYEQEAERQRQAALEESRQKTEPRYIASEQERALYEQVREEHNRAAQEHNNKRAELQKKFKEAKTEEEADAASDALDALGDEQYLLPEWKNLEKDIYFDAIQANRRDNIYAHRVAADELLGFYSRTRGRTEVPMSAQEKRVVKGYEDNRAQASKIFGVAFPRWGDLSNEAKAAYLGQIVNNAGLQQDVAFAKAGEQILKEKRGLEEGDRKRALENIRQIQAEVRKQAEKNKQELADIQKRYERLAGSLGRTLGHALSPDIVAMLRKGHLQQAIDALADGLSKNSDGRNKMAGQILRLIGKLGLKTKVQIAEGPLKDGDLGQYDPMTDTILLDPANGLSVSTLVHELLHAASVKVLNLYMTGQKGQLTDTQIRGVEQILKIMRQTQSELSSTYPEAYDNPFEFLAYALSNKFFQADLEAEGIGYKEMRALDVGAGLGLGTEDIVSLLPEDRNMWSAFKRAIAGILRTPKGAMQSYSFMLELNAALEDIASAPTEPINLDYLSQKSAAKKAEPQGREVKGIDEADPAYDLKEDHAPKDWKYWKSLFATVPGWQRIAQKFQNDRYHIKAWERTLDLAGKIYREGQDKINNIYEQIVLSTGLARNFYNQYIADPAGELDVAVTDFAKAMGVSAKEALNKLHRIVEALHEPERRMIKYLVNVPLSTAKTMANGTKSPAEIRAEIFKLLDTKRMNEAQVKQLRADLNEIVFAKDQNGGILYKNGVPQPSKYVDPLGDSPKAKTDKSGKQVKLSTDFNNEAMYSATGISPASAAQLRAEYEKHPHKAEIDRVMASIKTLSDRTAYLNQLSNYWSYPVGNRVAFYGWQYYAPFKGISHKEDESQLDFHSMGRGREFQDMPGAMEGRFSVSNNPVLQLKSDAVRSALRAGLKDVTLSVKNAIEQKLIPGEIKKITFEERAKFDPKELKGENTIFHYNEDGSINVLRVRDPKLLNSIRRTFQAANPLADIANNITSFFGKMHTRYNYQFAPVNFVRDALTNAFTIGVDMGPAQAAKFIKDISTMVVAKNGMYKAMQVAILYEKGDAKSQAALRQLAKTDPYLASMVEFIQQGGMVSYLQGMSIKSNFEELHREVGRSGVMTKKEQLEKFIDTWTDMFEIASRAAAYKIAKDNARASGETEQAAKVRAAAYSKNLANFEQVGEYGKALGAAYMFFRPAATGAVRAIEATAPAFPGSVERAVKRLPPDLDDAAKEKFRENYAKQARNSRIMLAALTGLGMMAYAMAAMTSDDDDLGRNAVATDNMQQWTRYARFHIPRQITQAMGIKDPVTFQMPWGFGLGSFMAAGAQMAAYASGAQSFGDMARNVFTQIALDSFVPIPVSRMPAEEMPLQFFLDSVAPSVTRPILEFALNKNGLGQDIYNDQNRRFGDAYTGGDNIPHMYKDVARWIANNTVGDIDVTPNTLYFLANSYLDGVSRVAEGLYGIADPANSRPSFNPKTDLPLMGSFFGARSNYDSREFSKVEEQILDMEKKIKMFDTDPVMSAQYDAKYPFNRMLVEMYNKQLNGELRDLRSQANEVRRDPYLPGEVKHDLVKIYTLQQNIAKREMIETFKAYGVKP